MDNKYGRYMTMNLFSKSDKYNIVNMCKSKTKTFKNWGDPRKEQKL